MQSSDKIKPIIPANLCVIDRDSYRNYLKKRYKVSKKVPITTPQASILYHYNHYNYLKTISILKKIFKTLKYAWKLDLPSLAVPEQKIYQSKLIYFAKRMYNTSTILINNIKDTQFLQTNNFAGVFDCWLKYLRKVETCHYQFLNLDELDHSHPIFPWRFPQFLRNQPNMRNLSISFLDEAAFNFPKYSVSLQRLCLQNLNSESSLITSLHHLKNLKDLHLDFFREIKPNVLVSILQTLPKVASSLQGLSLKWPTKLTPFIWDAFSALKSLTNVTKLKLCSKYFENYTGPPHTIQRAKRAVLFHMNPFFKSLEQHKHHMRILEVFENCPIRDLELELLLDSEEELAIILDFLRKHPNLEKIKLKIQCCPNVNADIERIREIFQAIDDLALLKHLAISFNPLNEENPYHEIIPLFSNIFTKAIPLESFKLKMNCLLMTKDGFLCLFESLMTISAGLKKLQIDFGKFKPEKKNEYAAVLSLIQSLKNIQSLKLPSLDIPSKQFWLELIKRIYGLKYIRTFIVGEIKGMMAGETKLDGLLMEIIQKRGLETFDCNLDWHNNSVIVKLAQGDLRNQGEKILKKNPSFKIFHCLEFSILKGEKLW